MQDVHDLRVQWRRGLLRGELCCPSGCANIQNDAKNCGGCGKDCGAGKCVNGNCQ